ncbi:MAG TPA: DUF3667 domain-containing protein [Saprospiraceae bacterium]|nr:DUF3667 domain-containing protein [Saprospiraceae bacterium]
MSHHKIRHEKNCLNCGLPVEERYCTHCGQENVEIQHSAFHLILHYIQDLFHYDGKVWHTLKNLLLKPGLVASEYMEGKRMRNLEPVRFYVFSSTVFFLLLFLMVNSEKWNPSVAPELNYTRRIYNLNQEKKFIKGSDDTVYVNLLLTPLIHKQDTIINDTTSSSGRTIVFDLNDPFEEDTSTHGWLGQLIQKRTEARRKEMEEKHQGDPMSAATDFFSEVFHKLPLLLFLSMPFFALFLRILYLRSSRKRYVEHFIFSVYHYSFLFMATGLFIVIEYFFGKLNLGWAPAFRAYSWTAYILFLCFYLWLSIGRFYNDRWYYRLPKYLLLLFLLGITIVLLFFLVFFITIMS